MKLLKGFDTKLQAALDADLVVSKRNTGKLRVSSFPFCSRKYLFDSVATTHQDFTVMGRYYTEVGTITHTIIQDALEASTSSIKMIRDYKCNDCGKHYEYCVKPKKCKCGSTNLQYLEHTVNYGKHIQGHIDDSILLPNKKIWAVDYKTTSLEKIVAYKKTGKGFPYESNVAQLSAYSAIKWQDGYDIEGYILVYIARDNPSKFAMVPAKLTNPEGILATLRRYDRQFDYIVTGQYAKLKPLCTCSEDIAKQYFCKYQKLCKSPTAVKEHTEHVIHILQKRRNSR